MNRTLLLAGACTLLLLSDAAVTTPAQSKRARDAPVTTALTGRSAPLDKSSAQQSGSPEAEHRSQVPVPVVVAGKATYEINWQSINAGGTDLQSHNYALHSSIGQSAIGYAASTSYSAGIGYWYGAEADTGTVGCSCPYQCDFDEDGFLTALDLGLMIDILFAGDPDVQDATCPSPRADFDCDGFSTALDLGQFIDHLFAGQPGPCDPCNP